MGLLLSALLTMAVLVGLYYYIATQPPFTP